MSARCYPRRYTGVLSAACRTPAAPPTANGRRRQENRDSGLLLGHRESLQRVRENKGGCSGTHFCPHTWNSLAGDTNARQCDLRQHPGCLRAQVTGFLGEAVGPAAPPCPASATLTRPPVSLAKKYEALNASKMYHRTSHAQDTCCRTIGRALSPKNLKDFLTFPQDSRH